MSWHYSQGLVAAYLEGTSSDGEQFAPSNGSPIPQAFLSPDRMKAFSRLFQFGMTFAPLTDDLGADVLTWFLEGFHVRTSAPPEKAQESTEPAAACGTTWPESFARWDRDTLLWKTPQCSLLEGLDEFLETWPRWGIMRNGACSERSTPAHLTSGTESGLWPTPTVCGNYNSKGMSAKSGDGLATAVNLWPTPCATDHKGSGKTGNLRDRLDYATERGATKSKTYATPQARDFRSGSTKRWEDPDRSRNLNYQIGGQLNPTWVEWLMGWPLEWTDLKQSETDRFQQWQHSHGKL